MHRFRVVWTFATFRGWL